MFLALNNQNQKRFLTSGAALAMTKTCIRHAGLAGKEINFHAMRRAFRSVVRNTQGIDAEFKEAIMGHKLKGSQEAYFDKDPLEFARQYAKCDFSRPNPKLEKKLGREIKKRDGALDIVEKMMARLLEDRKK